MSGAPQFFSWRSLLTLALLLLFLGLTAETVTLLTLHLSDPFWSRRLPWLNELRIQTGLVVGKRWGDLAIYLLQLAFPVFAGVVSAQVVKGLAEGLVVRVGDHWSYLPLDSGQVRLRLDRPSQEALRRAWRAGTVGDRRQIYRALLADLVALANAARGAGRGDVRLVLPGRLARPFFAKKMGLRADPPGLWQRLGIAPPAYSATLAQLGRTR